MMVVPVMVYARANNKKNCKIVDKVMDELKIFAHIRQKKARVLVPGDKIGSMQLDVRNRTTGVKLKIMTRIHWPP